MKQNVWAWLVVGVSAFVSQGCSSQEGASQDKKEGTTTASSSAAPDKAKDAASGSAGSSAPQATPAPIPTTSGSAVAVVPPATGTVVPPNTPVPQPPALAAGAANAYLHAASSCEGVITLDVVRLRANAIVAKDILPKLEALLANKPKDERAGKVLEFLRESGLTTKSPQNAAACLRNSDQEKVSGGVLLATDLPKGTFDKFIEKVSAGGKADKFKDLDGVKILGGEHVALGQLPDGVFAVSDSEANFKVLIPATNNVSTLGIDLSKELSFFLNETFVKNRLAKSGDSADVFENVKEIRGFIDLAANKLMVRAKCFSAFQAIKLQTMLALAKDKIADEKLAKNPFGLGDIVRSLTMTTDGDDLILEAPIPAATLDQLGKLAADELDKILKKM